MEIFTTLLSLLYILFLVLIIRVVVKAFKKNNGKITTSQRRKTPPAAPRPAPPVPGVDISQEEMDEAPLAALRKGKKAVSVTHRIADPKNDWLTRQLAEEKRAYIRIREMMGLRR